jgi:hypothetical protein
MEEQSGIRRRHEILQPLLDERSRRLVLAAEAAALGRGGIAAVARAELNIHRDEFHGEWNYTILPATQT